MRIWMNERYCLYIARIQEGCALWGRQAGVQFWIQGLSVHEGCPGAETELTAGYTEEVWDGGQGEFIWGS